MKKLFAIVLVLAMALAIAVPALAAEGWDKPAATTVPADDFYAAVTKYEYYSTESAGFGVNGTYFAEWPETKAVAKDIMGRAYAEMIIPSAADIAKLYPGVNADNMIITVTISNVKRVAVVDDTATTVDYFPHQSAADVNEANVYKKTFTNFAYDSAWDEMFVFTAASDAKVVVTLSVTAGDTELPGSFLAGANTIAVTEEADSTYKFTNATLGTIEFKTDDNDKIKKIYVTAAAAASTRYEVFKDAEGLIAFKNGGTSIYSGETGYAAPKAVFDSYMTALSFTWDNTTKYMNESLIVKNLFKTIDGSVSATFPAGSVTITAPAVEPPQTGDATTVVGFVMIALALVAAAYVTLKKVRA